MNSVFGRFTQNHRRSCKALGHDCAHFRRNKGPTIFSIGLQNVECVPMLNNPSSLKFKKRYFMDFCYFLKFLFRHWFGIGKLFCLSPRRGLSLPLSNFFGFFERAFVWINQIIDSRAAGVFLLHIGNWGSKHDPKRLWGQRIVQCSDREPHSKISIRGVPFAGLCVFSSA